MTDDPFAFLDDPETPEAGISQFLPAWFLDQMDENASELSLAQDYARHLIWKTTQPKTMDTVRKHFLAQWQFLQQLAHIDPDMFDEVQAAYTERAQAFEYPHLAA